MPTGYTCDIEKDISFEKFVMGCARAHGACVDMRDDSQDVPIPEEFKPSTYHAVELENSKEELEDMEKISISEASKKAIAEHDDGIKRVKTSIAYYSTLKQKYLDMRKKVERWIPPTDGHRGLRNFMFEQLDQSLRYDCDDEYLTKKLRLVQSKVPVLGEVWKKNRLDDIKDEIKRHRKEYALEVERVATNNKWVQDLRDSLKKEKV